MIPYKHTQVGYFMIVTLCIVTLFFVAITIVVGAMTQIPAFVWGVMIFVLFVLTSFASLSVVVDEKNVLIKFGYGIFQKEFPLQDIVLARRVTNHWYYGWGIRVWFWPYMWIYNVSGFDAVELVMSNGKIYRIGTDDALNLETAISATIAKK